MNLNSKKDYIFIILAGFFVGNAIMAELIGVKLILLPFEIPWIGRPAASVGVITWPIVLVITDLMNEYFGVEGVKKITFVTLGMIAYCFCVLYVVTLIPAADFSPVSDVVFNQVFLQSQWIIIGSIVAFAISQHVDVTVFWIFRKMTNGEKLWLRTTGSTVVSQLIDSIVVIGIAFWLPGKIKTSDFLNVAVTNYSYKLLIAIGLTPVIYFFHKIIDRYLGEKEAHQLIEQTAKKSN